MNTKKEFSEEFRRFIEHKCLPLTLNMGVKGRNEIRNKIRYKANSKEDFIVILNELGSIQNYDTIKAEFEKENENEQDEQDIETKTSFMEIEIQEALSHSKKPIQRLGQGVINDTFYYGTTLSYNGMPVSAVVTSKKDVFLGYNIVYFRCSSCGTETTKLQTTYPRITYPPKKCNCPKVSMCDWKILEVRNPIKDSLGINYRTEFNDDAIDYAWQTEAIKSFIEDDYPKKDITEIYKEILEINKKYIDHLDKNSHKYNACWIISTYCFTLFEHLGRIYFRAEKGSGKTKQCRINKFLCFNPMWITKGTESSIFRDAEATCGTFIVDNMDKLHEDLKRSIEHNIETGWMWDATYRLTNINTGRTEKYLSYTPMVINNIFGLDENTIDKTFEISMLKSVNKEIQRLKPTIKSEKWEEIRNSLMYYVLDNWEEIQETYEQTTADFSGREFDVVEGVLTIAKLVGDNVYDDLCKYIKGKIDEQFVNLEYNPHFIVFKKIYDDFLEKRKKEPLTLDINVFTKEIAEATFDTFRDYVNKKDEKEYKKQLRYLSKYVAKIIRSVPMFRKSGLSQGLTYITINWDNLERYMELQHFLEDKKDDKE